MLIYFRGNSNILIFKKSTKLIFNLRLFYFKCFRNDNILMTFNSDDCILICILLQILKCFNNSYTFNLYRTPEEALKCKTGREKCMINYKKRKLY